LGETRVDLHHLIEDLRDAYPGPVEETILTEIVANSLDSGAAAAILSTDPIQATLTVADDGSGMARRDLARFHDIAASTKTRGQGIGFAGVGIKLSLLVCEEVVTETRRGKSHVATSWRLASKHKAPWKWVPPPGLVAGERGTAVRLRLKNPLSPLLDSGFLEGALLRHFEPLLDSGFDEILAAHYGKGVRFVVDGRGLTLRPPDSQRAPLSIRLGRKRKPAALGYLIRAEVPLTEEQRGVAVSTLGKVIKRGWDWLGLSPGAPERVTGLLEAPGLAEALTLNKADFIRSGPRGMTYLAYRKAIQEAVTAQLSRWGEGREPAEEARRRRTRPFERDLQNVLGELADDFPLLASLVERRAGGQKRLPMGGRGGGLEAVLSGTAPVPEEERSTGAVMGEGGGSDGVTTESAPAGSETPHAGSPTAEPEVQGASPAASAALSSGPALGPRGPRRPARYGLALQFESRPEDPALGRLVESTVWVNEAHPAYRRAALSRSEGYHLALTVSMALAPLAVEPPKVHEFVTAFLARWGESLDDVNGRRRRRV
jgi:hypothetical protein